jgi:hypothetical protein
LRTEQVIATTVTATTTGDGAAHEAEVWFGSLPAVGTFVSIGELTSDDSFGVSVSASSGVSLRDVVSEQRSQGRARE